MEMGTSDSQFFLSFLLSCGWPNNKTKTFFRKSLRWTLHCDPPRPLKYAQQQLKIDTKNISPPPFHFAENNSTNKEKAEFKIRTQLFNIHPSSQFPTLLNIFPSSGRNPLFLLRCVNKNAAHLNKREGKGKEGGEEEEAGGSFEEGHRQL